MMFVPSAAFVAQIWIQISGIGDRRSPLCVTQRDKELVPHRKEALRAASPAAW